MLDMENIKNLSREELKKKLEKLRSRRKSGYNPPKTKISAKKDVLSSLAGVDEEVALKILKDLLHGESHEKPE